MKAIMGYVDELHDVKAAILGKVGANAEVAVNHLFRFRTQNKEATSLYVARTLACKTNMRITSQPQLKNEIARNKGLGGMEFELNVYSILSTKLKCGDIDRNVRLKESKESQETILRLESIVVNAKWMSEKKTLQPDCGSFRLLS